MKRFMIFIVLLVLFTAPGLSAYLFYTYPHWIKKVTTNKGHLIESPIFLAELGNLSEDNQLKSSSESPNKLSLNKIIQKNSSEKWQLILWYPHECDTVCVDKLNQLARIRLALGRRLYQVNQSLISNSNPLTLSKDVSPILKEQAINILPISLLKLESRQLKIWKNEPQIFIANPRHFIILNYPFKVNPKDLFHDLNQLLKVNNA